MEISVVVTNYNYSKFIGRCVRSLLNQNVPKEIFEIIVVDDCSTDESVEILKIFGESIRTIILDQNIGLGAASNVGIRSAKGRYVVRVDSDDYVHPDFLKILLLGFEFFGKDVEAISTDYFSVSPAGEIIKYGDARKNPIACGIAFKIDALESLGYYNPKLRLGEEIDLRNRFEKENFLIKHIELPLYKYVQHDSSLSKKSLI